MYYCTGCGENYEEKRHNCRETKRITFARLTVNKRINHNHEKRMLSIEECCDYVGLGKNGTRKLMKESGAEVKIGNRCLYDKHKIDTYFDNICQ